MNETQGEVKTAAEFGAGRLALACAGRACINRSTLPATQRLHLLWRPEDRDGRKRGIGLPMSCP